MKRLDTPPHFRCFVNVSPFLLAENKSLPENPDSFKLRSDTPQTINIILSIWIIGKWISDLQSPIKKYSSMCQRYRNTSSPKCLAESVQKTDLDSSLLTKPSLGVSFPMLLVGQN